VQNHQLTQKGIYYYGVHSKFDPNLGSRLQNTVLRRASLQSAQQRDVQYNICTSYFPRESSKTRITYLHAYRVYREMLKRFNAEIY